MLLFRSLRICVPALFVCLHAFAQTFPRAHEADGQIWVMWDVDTASPPTTYAIYSKSTPGPWTEVSQGTLVGRLYEGEWRGLRLLSEAIQAYGASPISGYVVPSGDGGLPQVLGSGEGLFVDTVRPGALPRAYAVVPWGQTSLTPDWISDPVAPTYRPEDPPRPHLQTVGLNTAATGQNYPVSLYVLWADGDQDENAGRPDFPIMGNAALRGSPHVYMAVAPPGGLSGLTNVPAVMALHGGNGPATAWLPSSVNSLSINHLPVDGYLIAPDEKIWLLQNGAPTAIDTSYLGYVRGFDPFTDHWAGVTNLTQLNPPADETVVNYTQRQMMWVLDWFVREKKVDPHRLSVLGHSNGSRGACQLARAFPDRFACVELFNNVMRYHVATRRIPLLGDDTLNLPVTLSNRLGQVHYLDVLTLNTRLSTERDLPFLRIYDGKCDVGDAMHWGEDLIADLFEADRTGWGFHFYWDLRKHGTDLWQDYWVDATSPASLLLQTQRDDVRNLGRYRSDQSFPAFFNLQDYPGHGDPGPGYLGPSSAGGPCPPARDELGNLVYNGDDHGTWGGYFDWDTTDIVDTPDSWECTMFLVGNSSGYADVDISPSATLTADVALRRPQQFQPVVGTPFSWELRDAATGTTLQTGAGVVGADDLVAVPGLIIPRDPSRARLVVTTSMPPGDDAEFHLVWNEAGGLDAQWSGDSTYSSQLEHSPNLEDWSQLDLPAPETDGPMALPVPQYLLDDRRDFFRLVRRSRVTTAVPEAPGFYPEMSFVHAGIARSYFLKVPSDWNDTRSWPVVFVLPGHGQSIADFASGHRELLQLADAGGWILVFAEATAGIDSYKWFASDDPNATQPYIDDAAFLLALADYLKASGLHVDPDRLYASGFSNGGAMVHYLAAKPNHPFAAFAIIESGTPPLNHYKEPYDRDNPESGTGVPAFVPPPWQPRPVLLMNMATSVPWPFEGRQFSASFGTRGARHNVARWTEANGFGSVPQPAPESPLPPPALLSTSSSWAAAGTERARVGYNHMRADYNWPGDLVAMGWSEENALRFRYTTDLTGDPVDDRIAEWVRLTYPHTLSPDPDAPASYVRVDSGTMTVETWRAAPADRTNEVIFVGLSDGGHNWPDAADKLPFDANVEVLKFFAAHDRGASP